MNHQRPPLLGIYENDERGRERKNKCTARKKKRRNPSTFRKAEKKEQKIKKCRKKTQKKTQARRERKKKTLASFFFFGIFSVLRDDDNSYNMKHVPTQKVFNDVCNKFDVLKLHGALDTQKGSQSHSHSASDRFSFTLAGAQLQGSAARCRGPRFGKRKKKETANMESRSGFGVVPAVFAAYKYYHFCRLSAARGQTGVRAAPTRPRRGEARRRAEGAAANVMLKVVGSQSWGKRQT